MSKFKSAMKDHQIVWRKKSPISQDQGMHNNRYYKHVLPLAKWEENLWPKIAGVTQDSLPTYLKNSDIRKHTGSHNLLSSWIMCANLYFPFRGEVGRRILLGFLRKHVSDDITAVTNVELEHEFDNPALTPATLLGEEDGLRGSGQTSPDAAFEVTTKSGAGIVLVECKFTEHYFYPCSGRKKNAGGKLSNPDRTRCDNAAAILEDPIGQCHLYVWGRRYWDHLAPIADAAIFDGLKRCPSATAGYQLFRQQSLAEGLANTGKLALVVSAVAYDERNHGLMHCLTRSAGIKDIRTDWSQVFTGKARFSVFTHQDWVNWVAGQPTDDYYRDWLRYIRGRYQL